MIIDDVNNYYTSKDVPQIIGKVSLRLNMAHNIRMMTGTSHTVMFSRYLTKNDLMRVIINIVLFYRHKLRITCTRSFYVHAHSHDVRTFVHIYIYIYKQKIPLERTTRLARSRSPITVSHIILLLEAALAHKMKKQNVQDDH